MTARLLDRCGLCDGENLELVLSLGSSPPTCSMAPVGVSQATVEHHPLDLLVCRDCTLAQLSVIVDPEVVFPVDYPYSSGHSRALHENFENLATQASRYLEPMDLVVDIGANDGTLLSKFPAHARTVGVEPTGQAHKIDGPAYRAFFDPSLARQIVKNHGRAKVITACNVLAHVPDIGDVMRGINLLLADDGVLIAENHDLASVVDGGQWDTVYHEHLRFYDPYSFKALLDQHNLGAMSCEPVPTHGGSFRMVAHKGEARYSPAQHHYDFRRLAQQAATTRAAIREAALDGLVGIGATARATTVIKYCGLDVEDVRYVCEVPGSDKIGRLIPGTRIPVADEAALFEDQPARVLLFSWHLADTVIPKLRDRGFDGEIIVPLPSLVTA
jgi:hypothetical protein